LGRSSPFGARRDVRPGDLHDHAAPGAVALRVARGVAQRVLAGELVGDRRVDAVQIVDLRREERASARFLRELAHHELRLAEAAGLRVGAAQRDRVDGGLGALGEIEHFVKRHEARGVLAVGEDHERLAADVFLALGADLPQLLERDIDGVVQRGGAAGRCLLDRRLELALVRGESLPDLDAAVEVDDLREVGRLQAPDEVDRGGLQRLQLVFHARAAVEQQRHGDGLLAAVEERDVLFHAVLEDGEVGLVEVRDVVIRAVHDGDVERDDVDGRPEDLGLASRRRGGRRGRRRRGGRRRWRLLGTRRADGQGEQARCDQDHALHVSLQSGPVPVYRASSHPGGPT